MFGISFLEMCVIAIVALIFVGPDKLPGLMKQLGKLFVQARRMSSEVKSGFDSVIAEAEKEVLREEAELRRQTSLKELPNGVPLAKPMPKPEAPTSKEDLI